MAQCTILVTTLPGPLNLIGGEFRPSASGGELPVISPIDGGRFAAIADSGPEDIAAAIVAARTAFDGAWGGFSAAERGRLMLRLALRLEAEAEALARLETRDNGKPIAQSRADMAALVRYFEYYGGAADKLHGEVIPFLNGYDVMSLREPHGVTGHIIPWNYPVQIFGRSVGAALAMGNATVTKPAEDACLSILRIGELAGEVGFPPGAINIVTGRGEVAGKALAEHPGVDFISFTGSPEVGVQIQIAAARNHIPCTLELGGKSPQIVFEDADLDAALPVIVNAIVQNGGQTCSAGSRVLIQRGIWDRLTGLLADRFRAVQARASGEDAVLGPLISARQRARVQRYMDGAGAPLIARGGIAPDVPPGGFYIAPALFGPVDPSSPLAQEEVFGPVLAAIPFDDEAEAIAIANGTEYGLVAGIWTRDGDRQARMARAMRCGQVYINGYGAGGGIELPFGGVRKSGHGREKGFVALHEFSRLKTIIHRFG
ncbi:aldehyde dehydrogenase (NAD+) [Paracoccus halophilus]|uniref:Aldehyde dehydrogenase n=1 Tax=Paracoccus halophilus TaxID=376733 RepID=A0A099F1L7_9RHOB|nr:aldehyde dehydrogenase family protein [Paracoccus halophilus]KGJ04146.1 aldehyde dehydrogenase [Paracoccus halophilus]SFA55756.1 aldehyde dehydrogenase (NAD+) [Paracoccus halophilus]